MTRVDESWRDSAVCAQTDPEVFFPEVGKSHAAAKQICSQCPVRELCLEIALANDERFGVWGGLSNHERLELKKKQKPSFFTQWQSERRQRNEPLTAVTEPERNLTNVAVLLGATEHSVRAREAI